MNGGNLLFSEGELRDHLERRVLELVESVLSRDSDALLATPTDDLVTELVEQYQVEPIQLHIDQMEQLPTGETKIDISQDRMRVVFDRSRPHYVSGSVVSVAVPFEGDPWLFRLRPSSWVMSDCYASIRENEIVIDFAGLEPTPEQAKREIDSRLDVVRRNVEHARTQVIEYNERLSGAARTAVEKRKAKLLHDRGLEGALGVRVRRRGDAPRPVPMQRKRIKPSRTRPSAPHYEDEYQLERAQYEDIIEIIMSMVLSLERSPTTFAKLSEEELRDHFLLQLNGTFEGQAGGELFNGAGKTDILVRVENRNVFVAECKIWRGPASFRKAIDQLLSYLVWRDTKAALVLFIKSDNATEVIQKAVAELRAHACYKRDGRAGSDSRVNAVLHQIDDSNREITVAFLPVVIRDRSTSGAEQSAAGDS
jgi:hypothetical protein